MNKLSIKTSLIKEILLLTKELNDEQLWLIINSEQCILLSVDFAHVGIVEINIKKEHFEFYEIEKPFTAIICPETLLKEIKDILSPNVQIEFTEKFISVKWINGFKHGWSESNVLLKTVDSIGLKPPKRPKITLPVVIQNIDSIDFLKIVHDCSLLSDKLTLEIMTKADKSQWLTISADNNEGEMYISYFIQSYADKEATSMYSICYLELLNKLQSHNLELSLGIDYPIKLSWSYENADFVYMIAPRIENK